MAAKYPRIRHVVPDTDTAWPWEDLRSPASGIRVGAVAPADLDSDGGLLFASNATETASTILQMPHGWLEESDVRPHVHWSKTSDAAGDVEWQIRYRVFNEGAVAPTWSSWISATGRSSEPGSTQIQVIETFPEIDMDGKNVSCMVSIQIQRDHDATDDNYGADAKLWEFDLHYQIDAMGSLAEYTKESY